ncbi:DUF938 domain-containing protein [Endozoicomonas sp. G2_1]|uniref:DUF938 domain-containing protein n=1 Tax=Endozoicomonas sp. G2_1 TaxID=2821091 RepID=UPI001ADC8980|nr:DUF938 domain-containing protein [Endozoicomonas sp. G2_1]MBO9490048.1 DUF938 domain-containing protein [Endozoicomonas sp. G2_1]
MLNFSPSCERNKDVILAQLSKLLKAGDRVLEIGSLSGQHALHFCAQRAEITWQCSDIEENIASLAQNITDYGSENCLAPIALTLGQPWHYQESYDVVFTANTLHIVSPILVESFFRQVSPLIKPDGLMLIYGPFKYQGQFTSPSNGEFELWLKDRDSQSGIRDFEWIAELAQQQGFELVSDINMPANNQLLVWRKK